MRGIRAYGAYVPYHRLDRSAIGAALGSGGGRGTRAVASYDEDTTTMGVDAARSALRSGGIDPSAVDQLWFSTTQPAYADKTNATLVHAALRLDSSAAAFDANGAVRSAAGILRTALAGSGTTLVVAADTRTGLPGSADETEGGDGAAAVVVGDGDGVVAELVATGTASEEFLDRWRTPGDPRSKQWEERFGETRYVPLAKQAWTQALKDAGAALDDLASVAVVGSHSRAVRSAVRKLGLSHVADDLSTTVGFAGSAHPGLVLASMLDAAEPGQLLALVVLADGADVFVFRTTEALAAYRPVAPVAAQIESGSAGLPYAKFLTWRGMLTVEPARRPEPARASSSAAARRTDWKFGFVGSQDRETGAIHLPPARVSFRGGAVDDMSPIVMADTPATVVTFTIDRLAYSPSPPTVFAVLDFDGGGRLPCELTDVDADAVAIGDRVEMTFRKINEADGIRNYFWKAKPLRVAGPGRKDTG